MLRRSVSQSRVSENDNACGNATRTWWNWQRYALSSLAPRRPRMLQPSFAGWPMNIRDERQRWVVELSPTSAMIRSLATLAKSKSFGRFADKSWEAYILEDFAELQKAGLTHPSFLSEASPRKAPIAWDLRQTSDFATHTKKSPGFSWYICSEEERQQFQRTCFDKSQSKGRSFAAERRRSLKQRSGG